MTKIRGWQQRIWEKWDKRHLHGIHFLWHLPGDTEAASEIANMIFWLHVRSTSVRVMLMARKKEII